MKAVLSAADIRSELAVILAEIADVNPDDVTDEKAMRADLDVDSLAMIELMLAAEDKFGIHIPDDEARKLTTVGDVIQFVRQATA